MAQSLRWTSADLERLPDNGKRYEIIDGELYVSKQPKYYHQVTCAEFVWSLESWNHQARAGSISFAPGVVFSDDDDVVPDVAWISRERLAAALDDHGHLRAAPDLVIEVLSPGSTNEQRDRETKLKLYSRRGVLEYWIADWRLRQVDVYRRSDQALQLVATFREGDVLTSPHLPGYHQRLDELFADLPRE